MNPGYRQEVLNVILAQLLRERGIISSPENILKIKGEERKLPDVLVNYCGLRTVIEGEVADGASAPERALAAARRRVEQGIAHISIAVVYPSELRKVDFNTVKDHLADIEVQIAIVTEAEDTGFTTSKIEQLEIMLRKSFELLREEDIVGRATAVLDAGVEAFAMFAVTKPGYIGRLAKTLNIQPLPRRQKTKVNHEDVEAEAE